MNTEHSSMPHTTFGRPTLSQPTRHSVRASRLVGSGMLHLLALAIALLAIFPFFWMVSSSVKPQQELFLFPPKLLPSRWVWENYIEAWRAARFSRYAVNTVIVAVFGTSLTLIVCAMAAYAFARMRFRGRNTIFWLVLFSQMIPGIITLVPSFIVVKSFPLAGGNDWLGRGGYGLLNSHAGLILPGAAAAFGVFLLRQFFQTLPAELSDAARIDGCGEFRIFWRIVLPLSKAALATLAIFAFQAYWNDFIWPLVVISDDKYKTIQLGLIVFRQRFATEWGPMMAGVTIATIPMLLFFLAAQRYFVQGIALSGLKG